MPFQIIKPGTHIDFLSRWRVCVSVSVLVILLGLAAIPLRGFRLGIDFAGGTEVQVGFVGDAPVDEGAVRSVVEALGIENASVIRYGEESENEFLIKFRGGRELTAPDAEAVAAPTEEGGVPAAPPRATAAETGAVTARTDRILALQTALEGEIGLLEVQRVEFVGPKVGEELRDDGLAAMAIACLLILVYIAFRFSTRFAPGAVMALVHDVMVTASVWILLGLEFDLKVLAAFLAIIGYSLNDTIIVFDRIRENMELRTKHDLFEVLNLSVNQTLSRTLLTSATTLGTVLALLLLGGPVIRPFALAMTIGIAVGTYSSIYIAAPTLWWLESRFGGQGAGRKAPARTGKGARPARA